MAPRFHMGDNVSTASLGESSPLSSESDDQLTLNGIPTLNADHDLYFDDVFNFPDQLPLHFQYPCPDLHLPCTSSESSPSSPTTSSQISPSPPETDIETTIPGSTSPSTFPACSPPPEPDHTLNDMVFGETAGSTNRLLSSNSTRGSGSATANPTSSSRMLQFMPSATALPLVQSLQSSVSVLSASEHRPHHHNQQQHALQPPPPQHFVQPQQQPSSSSLESLASFSSLRPAADTVPPVGGTCLTARPCAQLQEHSTAVRRTSFAGTHTTHHRSSGSDQQQSLSTIEVGSEIRLEEADWKVLMDDIHRSPVELLEFGWRAASSAAPAVTTATTAMMISSESCGGSTTSSLPSDDVAIDLPPSSQFASPPPRPASSSSVCSSATGYHAPSPVTQPLPIPLSSAGSGSFARSGNPTMVGLYHSQSSLSSASSDSPLMMMRNKAAAAGASPSELQAAAASLTNTDNTQVKSVASQLLSYMMTSGNLSPQQQCINMAAAAAGPHASALVVQEVMTAQLTQQSALQQQQQQQQQHFQSPIGCGVEEQDVSTAATMPALHHIYPGSGNTTVALRALQNPVPLSAISLNRSAKQQLCFGAASSVASSPSSSSSGCGLKYCPALPAHISREYDAASFSSGDSSTTDVSTRSSTTSIDTAAGCTVNCSVSDSSDLMSSFSASDSYMNHHLSATGGFHPSCHQLVSDSDEEAASPLTASLDGSLSGSSVCAGSRRRKSNSTVRQRRERQRRNELEAQALRRENAVLRREEKALREKVERVRQAVICRMAEEKGLALDSAGAALAL